MSSPDKKPAATPESTSAPNPLPKPKARTYALRTKRLALSAILAAMAIIFSYIEALIPLPVPIPGIKLGLANLVIVIAIYRLGFKYAFIINCVRILITGLLFTGLFGAIYSFAGGVLSIVVMYLLYRTGLFSMVGVSMAGGVFHKVKLNNNSGFPVSVTIIAGFGDIKDDSVFFSGTVKVEPKRAYPVFQRAVVGLNTVQNLAAPEFPDYCYAVVQNRGTNDLYIRAFPKEYTYAPPDSDVNSAFLLPPNASIALPPYLSTNYEFKFWRPRSLNKADVFITYFIYE